MTFILNDYEVQDYALRYEDHPILGPATQTLANLVDWTYSNSDGWPYWSKPSNASKALQSLIHGERLAYLDDERADVTVAAYRAALRPIKAFRTRQGADFVIVEVSS